MLDLILFIEAAMMEETKIRVTSRDGTSFTCIPGGRAEEEDELAWSVYKSEDYMYSSFFLKDVASICRVDHPEICWTAPVEA